METAIQVSDDTIKCLLCSAFEGGSNYWYEIVGQKLAKGLKMADFGKGGKMQDPEHYWHWCQLIPMTKGCALIIKDYEGDTPKKRYRLDRDAIEKGLSVMAEKHPRHFGDVIAENDDAITGDVFLQCCLFGEVIYG